MTLNGVISSFATGTYTVTRAPDGAYVDGVYTPPDPDETVDIDVASIDDTADTLVSVGHGLDTGDGPFHLVFEVDEGHNIATPPTPLSIGAEYWVIVDDVDTLRLATSEANALALIAIDITDDTGLEPFAISNVSFQRIMCIQPATGRTLDAVPEADRTSDMQLVFCDVELQTRAPGHEPDSIEVDGESWTVVRSEKWKHWGERHWRVFIARDEVT